MSVDINIEISEATVKQLVLNHIAELMGNVNFEPRNVHIEVKSKQNYRSEWEEASFRARLHKSTTEITP